MMLSTVTLATRSDMTKLPSRITVTRWQVLKTSARRWEMNSTAPPLGAQCRDHLEEPLDLGVGQGGGGLVHDDDPRVEGQGLGDLDDLLVGHGERRGPGWRCPGARPSDPRTSVTTSFIAPQLMRLQERRGWRPMKMFSATERSGNSVGSW